MKTNTHKTIGLMGLSVLLGVALVFAVATIAHGAPPPSAGAIRLQDQSTVTTQEVLLQDVAQLDGELALSLSDTPVATLRPGDTEIIVRLDQIRDTLTQLGVNWGMLTLGGYSSCRVDFAISQDGPGTTPTSAPVSPLVANPIEEIDLSSRITLEDRLIDLIERFAGVDRTDLQITFAKNDAATLALSAWEDRYEFEPLASAPLGRVPIVIRRYRDHTLVDTYRVKAVVARRYLAVATTRSIGRGQTFAPGDVEIREVYIDNPTDQPLTNLSEVIGQSSAGVLRTGVTVLENHLRSPVMVRRGELITIRCITAGLVVKTVGRAGSDGTLGQLIQVRHERSREKFTARVTGPQEGVTLHDDYSNPSTQAAAGPADSTTAEPSSTGAMAATTGGTP